VAPRHAATWDDVLGIGPLRAVIGFTFSIAAICVSNSEIHFRRSHKTLKLATQAPMWRNGRRNGLKIRWAVKGPCRFESGHRQFFSIADCESRTAD
jgi:hypothetical protein